MKLTKRKTLKLTIEMWDWLSTFPDEWKADWPGWVEKGIDRNFINGECFLCEYSLQQSGDSTCERCLFRGRWVKDDPESDCEDYGSPYILWLIGKDRSANAKKIADLGREVLVEMDS